MAFWGLRGLTKHRYFVYVGYLADFVVQIVRLVQFCVWGEGEASGVQLVKLVQLAQLV